jgi:MFS family permease
MQLGRIGQAMLPIVLVLYALDDYGSPPLAGLLTFLTVFPGLLAAPLLGALLDRYGRVLAIRVDYVTGATLTGLLGVLVLGGRPDALIVMALSLVIGVTQIFSDAGFRSLFAHLAPSHLWERVNAADSIGYQLAFIVGPPVAAATFAILGAAVAFLALAGLYAISILSLIGLREPQRAPTDPSGVTSGVIAETLEGVAYVWRNQTLRAIGSSVSVANIGFGIVTILVSVVIVDVLSADPTFVGIAFAVAGVLGVVAAVFFGRVDTLDRERWLIVAAHVGIALSAVLLVPAPQAGMAVGVGLVVVAMALLGFSGGVWDIGIFTLRQRKTDPQLMGRAFATSMALNQSGFPIGAAIGGWLAASSVSVAIWVAVAFGVAGTLLALVLLPRSTQKVRPAEL